MNRAQFTIIEDTPEVLCLLDLGPWTAYPTITNDAEAVVFAVRGQLGERRLEYIDSEGERSRLLVSAGQFAGFADCP